ncbi:retrovirus-related pol polyprotein from transposon TNT 1-94, partial [Tanacetum coccineum]
SLSILEEALGAFGKSQTYWYEGFVVIIFVALEYLSKDIQRIYELFVKCRGQIQGRGYDRGQEAEQKQVEIMDKEVNQAARDSDDALVCCVARKSWKGSSYDPESWTLKDVRYISFLKRRLISVGKLDEEGYPVGFEDEQWKVIKHQRLSDMSRIGISMLASKGNVPDVGRGWSKFIQKAMALHLLHQFEDPATMILLLKTAAGVAIRLCILEEEWQGNETSLTHLKVFGCDSFVKVKNVCGEAMKCTFIGSGSDEVRYSFQDTKSHQVIRSKDITFVDSIYGARSATNSSSLTKPIQKSQVLLVDISENVAENDSLVAEHGLSSEITQSPSGSSDTSEGSENNRSFKDSERSDEEYSEDGASSKEGGFESLQVRRSTRESRASVRLPAEKKASQRLWMFKVKEEQDKSKSCEDDYNQLAGQKENLECRLNEILYGLIQAPMLQYLKFDSFMQKDKAPTWQSSTSLSDSWNEEPCRDVHHVGEEREVKVLRIQSGHQSELITEDDVLPERGYSQFNDVSSGYLRLLEEGESEVDKTLSGELLGCEDRYRPCCVWTQVAQPQLIQIQNDSSEERPIVVLGLRGGLLGANPISHRLARSMQFGTGRAVWHDRAV